MGHSTGKFSVEGAVDCKKGATHALVTILPGDGDSVDFRPFSRELPYGQLSASDVGNGQR
jgi:hypothetical protein